MITTMKAATQIALEARARHGLIPAPGLFSCWWSLHHSDGTTTRHNSGDWGAARMDAKRAAKGAGATRWETIRLPHRSLFGTITTRRIDRLRRVSDGAVIATISSATSDAE